MHEKTMRLAKGLLLATAACGVFSTLQAATPSVHMVSVRDGTLLATDVYLPENAAGPVPVVLMRTPYDRTTRSAHRLGDFYTGHGYAFVAQDTRGRYGSRGQDSVFATDGVGPNEDGFDTIEWIARQPWSNGRVGMVGESAPGITSYLAAATGHPALVCAQAGYAASSLYDDLVFPGGVYRRGMVEAWTEHHTDSASAARSGLPSRYGPLWERMDLVRHAGQAHAAIYHWGGWYDVADRGTVAAFGALQENGGDGARGRQILVMGPWTHGNTGRKQGELVYPANCDSVNPLRETLAWFDLHLKGEENELGSVPPVRYYLMGDVSDSTAPGNLWRSASTWPPEGSRDSLLYLQAGGGLSSGQPGEAVPPDRYTYDPRDPARSKGGHNIPREGPSGPADQRETESRADVLTFTTAPLDRPLATAGNGRLLLYASSSAEDTDFIAKLSDVYPDGRSMLLLEGAIRAAHRNTFRRDEPLMPGQVYRFDIDLWNTAIVFNRGHRIRVSITSSSAPRFDPSRNRLASSGADTAAVVAENAVYHDAAHPSALVLPVLLAGP